MFWIDQSPEHAELHLSVSQVLSNFQKAMTDAFRVPLKSLGEAVETLLPSVKTFTWEDPKSNPIKDLEVAWWKDSYENYNRGGIVLGRDPAIVFYDEIQPAKGGPALQPLDEAGRPATDASGGRVRRSGPDLCPRHGLERIGGRCKRCR